MGDRQVIEADLTWVDGGFLPGVKITIGANGRLDAVGSSDAPVSVRLKDRAILPGSVLNCRLNLRHALESTETVLETHPIQPTRCHRRRGPAALLFRWALARLN